MAVLHNSYVHLATYGLNGLRAMQKVFANGQVDAAMVPSVSNYGNRLAPSMADFMDVPEGTSISPIDIVLTKVIIEIDYASTNVEMNVVLKLHS